MAEVVIKHRLDKVGLADRISVESAGTGEWHIGEPADPRALAALRERGYDGTAHRARQFTADWFGRFDLVLALDQDNYAELTRLAAARGVEARVPPRRLRVAERRDDRAPRSRAGRGPGRQDVWGDPAGDPRPDGRGRGHRRRVMAGPLALCSVPDTETSSRGMVYRASSLTCVRKFVFCRHWLIDSVPSTSGTCAATSQLSLDVRPVLSPP